MLKQMLVLFLIGHVLGDFYFQSDDLALAKNKSFSRLVKHSLIYLFSMGLILLPVYGFDFIKWVLVVSFIHFIIDAGMFYLKQNKIIEQINSNTLYLVDQLLHVLTLLITAVFISARAETVAYTHLFHSAMASSYINISLLLNWIAIIAIIIKPVSITINKMLAQYQPTTVKEEEKGHPGAGALIGVLERLIILIMLSQNQYGAIGFVLTAKSIARYNKITENPQFSEYYLLGTLLSMLLVIATYIILF